MLKFAPLAQNKDIWKHKISGIFYLLLCIMQRKNYWTDLEIQGNMSMFGRNLPCLPKTKSFEKLEKKLEK